jgi:hypothetical protein
MKLLFANNISINEDDSISLSNYLMKAPYTWKNFYDLAINRPFKIRVEIMNLVPMSGYFFKGSFMYVLKKE